MFQLNAWLRYYLYSRPADMRKGFDGLSGLVANELGRDPHSGEVFVFVNSRRTHIKLLHWESGGFTLYYKRLESGTFELPKINPESGGAMITWHDLLFMIEGVSLSTIRYRKRFELPRKMVV